MANRVRLIALTAATFSIIAQAAQVPGDPKAALMPSSSSATPTQSGPSSGVIQGILVDRIDRLRQSLGIVVGIIDPAGRRIVAYGISGGQPERPLDGDTVYQIGSVTKIFTSLLMSDMTQRKQVSFDDPLQKFLPREVHVPEHNGRGIALLDLATQTSGLPRLPSNFKPQNPANPYVDYTAAQLYEFLSTFELPRDPGLQYEYSNLGFGLLGHALALRSGQDYEMLIRTRICDQLGMSDTRISMTPEMAARRAGGHDANLNPVPDWDFQVLAGAGAIRSTANDLLKFLAAYLEYTETPLRPAMRAMQVPRYATGMPNLDVGIGWQILTKNDNRLVWHNGGTYGYTAFLGFNPTTRVGIVVLSNVFTLAGGNFGVDDIGLHLLDSRIPLAKIDPRKDRKPISLDEKTLERYVGRYQLMPNFVLTLTREGAQLFAQASGQPRVQVFPESATEFFYKVVDAQITFSFDVNGKVTQLLLHQAGQEMVALRIE